ncbi:MAG: hypothetical protein IPF51_13995 [Dehalococcoidia bacterium]|jgi:hypothetical protein|uniref:hypothetical protein n=1 Tax=Candidatus Amarobacter glycogenicus TaxID=3140699 RepID=UPI002A0C97CE|nr:hypothetical protein [Dehalococcoidia bacterium]MBK8559485.1 hypothetical protein [Dehalococcoidia bacterium]MBK9545980.1 hypothetical protein [Dehalococcoidia bacterium]MBK9610821.1 hypothetical protein [Dehalococcoidia bacterium]MCC6267646.1 hypothetical protein [Dehalococcoidia bacterium]
MRRTITAGLAALALLTAVLSGGGAAHANGVPQLVKLTYLEGVSNFGPKDAEGVLEFSFAEAYARVDVKNLKPAEGYTYEGWLMGSAKPLRVGVIPVNASGIGALDTKLEGLATYDYNLFVVAARKSGTDQAAQPSDISIAGRFTVIGDDASGGAAGDIRPGQLPETGEASPPSLRERIGRTITIAAAAGGLAFAFLRIMQRRKVSHDQRSL